MHKGAGYCNGSALLTAAGCACRNQQATVSALEGACEPQLAELIDEGLALGGEIAKAGSNAKQGRIVCFQTVWCDLQNPRVNGRSMHHLQYFLRKGFGGPELFALKPWTWSTHRHISMCRW